MYCKGDAADKLSVTKCIHSLPRPWLPVLHENTDLFIQSLYSYSLDFSP